MATDAFDHEGAISAEVKAAARNGRRLGLAAASLFLVVTVLLPPFVLVGPSLERYALMLGLFGVVYLPLVRLQSDLTLRTDRPAGAVKDAFPTADGPLFATLRARADTVRHVGDATEFETSGPFGLGGTTVRVVPSECADGRQVEVLYDGESALTYAVDVRDDGGETVVTVSSHLHYRLSPVKLVVEVVYSRSLTRAMSALGYEVERVDTSLSLR